jgi:hypothetical protein
MRDRADDSQPLRRRERRSAASGVRVRTKTSDHHQATLVRCRRYSARPGARSWLGSGRFGLAHGRPRLGAKLAHTMDRAVPSIDLDQWCLTAINRSFGCLNFSAPSAMASFGVAASTVPSHLAGVSAR